MNIKPNKLFLYLADECVRFEVNERPRINGQAAFNKLIVTRITIAMVNISVPVITIVFNDDSHIAYYNAVFTFGHQTT